MRDNGETHTHSRRKNRCVIKSDIFAMDFSISLFFNFLFRLVSIIFTFRRLCCCCCSLESKILPYLQNHNNNFENEHIRIITIDLAIFVIRKRSTAHNLCYAYAKQFLRDSEMHIQSKCAVARPQM